MTRTTTLTSVRAAAQDITNGATRRSNRKQFWTEYGILYSHPAELVYPDLVRGGHATEDSARTHAVKAQTVQPGLDYTVMRRSPGQPWLELSSGRSAADVLAQRWRTRIDCGGWSATSD